MPFTFRIINGSKTVCKIKYVCKDCEFATYCQDDELEHECSKNHFVISTLDKQSVIPYTKRLHGEFPERLQ